MESETTPRGASTARLTLGVLLAALTGLMLLLSFPPDEVWWLAWFAFIPSLVALFGWASLAGAEFQIGRPACKK